ncbi:hypothetical protein NQZ68_010681 [Dissostichus eleginoides]|nr:hypothetical protein NQZ68_010681 [Dissostichus eleginoides]
MLEAKDDIRELVVFVGPQWSSETLASAVLGAAAVTLIAGSQTIQRRNQFNIPDCLLGRKFGRMMSVTLTLGRPQLKLPHRRSAAQIIVYDVNECEETNGGCEALCSNTIGSFYCRCPPGQKLNEEGKTCQVAKPRGQSALQYGCLLDEPEGSRSRLLREVDRNVVTAGFHSSLPSATDQYEREGGSNGVPMLGTCPESEL